MLVECGFFRAQARDGTDYTFSPSLARIAALGTPRGIVELYAALHGPKAQQEAAYVLATLCDQDDATPLIGGTLIDPDDHTKPERIVIGEMPAAEQVILARRLMHHGVIGQAKPGGQGSSSGHYAEAFNAAEFVSFARVHLGLGSADAEALSMTELQQMIALKFPDANKPERDVPTREEYEAFMSRVMGKRNG